MLEQIQTILNKALPTKAYIEVKEYSMMGSNYIKIFFSASDYNINDVAGQKPQAVSLSLNINTLELQPQVFGGCGGQRITRKPNMEDPKEKFLAMKGIQIPFRTPQKNEKAVLGAIERFAQNWVKLLKENKEVLTDNNIVDYDELLK